MSAEKQLLGQSPIVQNYPEPPPPYSPWAPQYAPPGNSEIPPANPGEHLQEWKGQPPAMPLTMPPTTVQPTIQVQSPPPMAIALGPTSMRITCQHCHADVSTRVDKGPTMVAYLFSIILCLIGCTCGCCLIPFYMDSCKTSEHFCPHCKKFIGRYSRG